MPGLPWGSPLLDGIQAVYQPDESDIVVAACKFPAELSIEPHPTFYHYFLGLLIFPIKMVLKYSDPESFLLYYHAVHLYSRVVTFLFSICAMLMTYFLGRKMYDKKHGLIASAIVALATVHITYSYVVSEYVPLSFFEFFIFAFHKLRYKSI